MVKSTWDMLTLEMLGDGGKRNTDLHSLKHLTLLKYELHPIVLGPKIEAEEPPIHVMS